ncbi:uncharacterized protein LOC143807659 isoform X1 [Ranitomeya variabilis]|uniref:uncharacterized protein LOC143782679 isoform X1 n=1 Tax=Ranitomeya variabilis TaxID=490064 RepID=UPI00405662CD
MGVTTSCSGLQNRVLFSSPTKIPDLQPPSHHNIAHVGRYSGSAKNSCDCPGTSPRDRTGILLKPILYNKTFGRVKNYHKSQTPKFLGSIQTIQNGIDKIYDSPPGQGSGYVHSRLKECVLPRSYLPKPPKISEVCSRKRRKSPSLPVSLSAVRSSFSAKSFYKDYDRGSSLPKKSRYLSHPVSGRLPSGSRHGKSTQDRLSVRNLHTAEFGVDHKLEKIRSSTQTEDKIPRGHVRLRCQDVLFAGGKTPRHNKQDSSLREKQSFHQGCYENPRNDDGMHTLRKLVSVSLPTASTGDSLILGQKTGVLGQGDTVAKPGENLVALVDRSQKPQAGSTLESYSRSNNYHGRKSARLGRPHPGKVLPRSVDPRKQHAVLKLQRAARSLEGPIFSASLGEEQAREGALGQHDSSGVPSTSGWPETQSSTAVGGTNLQVGRSDGTLDLRSSPGRFQQPSSRLPEQEDGAIYGMGAKQRGFQRPVSSLGVSGDRPLCNQTERKDQHLLFTKPSGKPSWSRCLLPIMGQRPVVRVPTACPNPKNSQEDRRRWSQSPSCSTVLAEEELVYLTEQDVKGETSYSSTKKGSPLSRSRSTPESGIPPSISLDPERQVLRAKGLSDEVISTLKASRKPVTSSIYLKIWKKFCSHCGETAVDTDRPNVPKILDFLQAGFNAGLRPSTLRVQIAALSVFYDCTLSAHPWISRFSRAVARLKPLLRKTIPPWDLNLVLNELCKIQFNLDDNPDIGKLSLKTAFLVAITSAKRLGELQALSIQDPYLQIFHDRLVLRLDPAFLPKVVSDSNINQEVILPSFFQSPRNQKESLYHSLDVKESVLKYLEITAPWRVDNNLFVQFRGPNKGKKASKSTIARWIRSAIISAYKARGRDPPGYIRAHSSRSMAASWAEKGGASADQICNAASWSNLSTFSKHYKLDVMSTQLSFGRRVLQAVFPP